MTSVVFQIRYETNVTNGDEFYTDSNGREMLKRTLNFRPSWKLDVQQPVAGNYYPVTAAIYIQVSGHTSLWLLPPLVYPRHT